ncbi:spore gernimation protein [Bacillus sp. SA1-12]|uniref:GerAB/ArcD/ProY family transporter n=1 Tax=Bacillus sp. SA1-12 TaxID=1455638 RepID=UPI0006272821|nr:endospore germination permease [Bacillus sp. SA1-12]KKI88448.1 spore gernimation protein [Bacillus sp. SA1-12]
MLENGKINGKQFSVLVFMFTTGSSLLLAPSMLTSEAKQDAWLAAILGVVVGISLTWLYQSLGNLYSDMTLVEYSEKILGKWIGKALSLLFFTFSFILAALVLRNIGDFISTQIMPETPIQSIHILFLIIVMMGTRYGLETLARAGEILFPVFIVLFLLLFIFISPQIELEKIQPILKEGINPVLRSSLLFIGFPFLELVIFLMIFPFVNKPKEAGKALFMGTWMGGLIVILLTALAIMVIGADYATSKLYPSYFLAHKINIGNFLQRIEAIVAIMWFISIFFKLTICFYVSTLSLAQILNLKEYRMLVFPLGMILIVLSIISSPNIAYGVNVILKLWTTYALTFGLFLPLLLLGMAAVRRNVKPKSDKKEG